MLRAKRAGHRKKNKTVRPKPVNMRLDGAMRLEGTSTMGLVTMGLGWTRVNEANFGDREPMSLESWSVPGTMRLEETVDYEAGAAP